MSIPGGPYKIGHQIGPYTLESYLGAGGFKNVYRARRSGGQENLPAVVALGFPHLQDGNGQAEAMKEFSLTSRLNHPNICRIFCIEKYDGIMFLVMEHLDGETLRSRLKHVSRLSAEQALAIVGQLGEALAYAHEAKVIHRDVKPENIFITAGHKPMLLDFGVARALSRTNEVYYTPCPGTLEYMAPEQLLHGATGTNADLWALGVTFYEMLAGHRPFQGPPEQLGELIRAGRYDEKPLFAQNIEPPIVRIIRKMLNKDPEQRYTSAEKLSSDIEVLARRARLADDDEGRLEVFIRASVPLISIMSFEEARVLESIRNIVQRLAEEYKHPRHLYIWSASRGLRDEKDKLVLPTGADTLIAALYHVIGNTEDAIYVFLDVHRHYTPMTARLVRDAARAVRVSRKSLLFISPFYEAPEELQKELTFSVFQLPDRLLISKTLAAVEEETKQAGLPVNLNEDDRAAVVRAAMGLTSGETTLALRAAVAESDLLDGRAARSVVNYKTRVIRQTGILEYHHDSESFADVGGLDHLLKWFRHKKNAFSEAARYAGLVLPKGVFLMGVPGCGKSLCARAVAGSWQVPLLRLDVGRIFGPYVGQSEANLRLAIQTAEAVSPCVFWIDEVEKGFAGVHGHGGGGVAARVFGGFLNWLQEKRSSVFVVATANNIAGIPAELLRQGRFDDIFFIGLPAEAQRRDIFRIHLGKRRHDPDKFDLAALAAATKDFSGAEIEQVVIASLFAAFDAQRELQTSDLQTSITETIPLSRSRALEISQLTAWAKGHAKLAG